MNIASLELCKELWRLSGWTTDWHYIAEKNPGIIVAASWREHEGEKYICPAYDLGYLLRKLGDLLNLDLMLYTEDGKWRADVEQDYSMKADTPEDATCKLAIELFKQGVLTAEEVK